MGLDGDRAATRPHAGRARLRGARQALARIDLPRAELEGLSSSRRATRAPGAAPARSAWRRSSGSRLRALVEVECGGASSLLAFKAACQEVATGQIEVAAVIGAQAERRLYEEGMDEGDLDRVLLLASMIGPYVAPYGVLTAVPCYALSAQRYMHEHDVSAEEIAELPVRLRRHAALNPIAEHARAADRRGRARLAGGEPARSTSSRRRRGPTARPASSSRRRSGRAGADSTAVVLTGWGEAHDSANFVAFEAGAHELPVGARVD